MGLSYDAIIKEMIIEKSEEVDIVGMLKYCEIHEGCRGLGCSESSCAIKTIRSRMSKNISCSAILGIFGYEQDYVGVLKLVRFLDENKTPKFNF
ncbi:MAG: hypothetical protein RR744_00385 [Cellulosilyticaceae bacterium]